MRHGNNLWSINIDDGAGAQWHTAPSEVFSIHNDVTNTLALIVQDGGLAGVPHDVYLRPGETAWLQSRRVQFKFTAAGGGRVVCGLRPGAGIVPAAPSAADQAAAMVAAGVGGAGWTLLDAMDLPTVIAALGGLTTAQEGAFHFDGTSLTCHQRAASATGASNAYGISLASLAGYRQFKVGYYSLATGGGALGLKARVYATTETPTYETVAGNSDLTSDYTVAAASATNAFGVLHCSEQFYVAPPFSTMTHAPLVPFLGLFLYVTTASVAALDHGRIELWGCR